MGQNWKMDPKIGDYVIQGGSPLQTDSLQMPAYFRLKTQRTRWLYAPSNDYGSDFYTVVKRPAENANKKLENIALAALKPMIEDGRAAEVEANVIENARSGVALEVKIEDASGEVETQTFTGLR